MIAAMTTEIPVPSRMTGLPRDNAGRVVPWFVWFDPSGKPDFRVIAPDKVVRAVNDHRCFTCGFKILGPTSTFVIGPMCAVNRVSAEPPSHAECAVYSARVCPFLTNPKKVRRETDIPESAGTPGVMIPRNPGMTLVWTTRHWHTFNDGRGGMLFDIGDPTRVAWFARGREATCDEVRASIDSGLPLLAEVAREEGPEAEADLAEKVARAMILVRRA